ncbi:hypothetical protein AVEN_180745-1 [Araneus ventricosus]|uniref:Uncharacterized protein n=1 Tax=Araneus ventricosus TaxID=182803 RepID=A0A4Y2CIJ9_ARAVE|nr:hypothetical protein AVEN_137308-1 [Araneus ventricosus]GBM03736.1 hypothetical protein AVEN_180745-1 [Araneus ventricosus]
MRTYVEETCSEHRITYLYRSSINLTLLSRGDFFLQAPLKPGYFGRLRNELDSSNLGGHLPPTSPPAFKAQRNELCLARIIGAPTAHYLLSDLRNSPPLKRSQPSQTGLRRR